MDFDALMKKKLGGKYNNPSPVESQVAPPEKETQATPKNKGQKSLLETEGYV